MDGNHYLTTEELAQRWRTTRDGILSQRHRGNTPRARLIGNRLLWRLDEIEAFEEERANTPQPAS